MSPLPDLRRRSATLRFRVTALATVAVLVLLTAASVALVLAQRAILTDNLDEALGQRADAVAGALEAGTPGAADAAGSEDVLVVVVGGDGRVVSRSPAAVGERGWTLPSAPVGAVTTVTLPGGQGRMVVRSVGTATGGTLTVRVAGSLDDVRESTAALAGSLAVAVPISVAALAAIVWWSVGRALRPVDDIRAEVDLISGARLDRRVPVPPTRDEVARLARTMNAMLDRLADAAERQRRFVGDASHELRGPLARIRSELEVDAAHPSTADLGATHRSVLAETVGLQTLVDDLLLLARGDAGALAITQPVTVDLATLVRVCADEHAPDPTPVRVDVDGVEAVHVPGDPAQLRRLVANLVDNALQHAARTVTVTLAATPGGSAELVVLDDGPGIPAEHADDVFLRFFQLDDARPATDGVGLGLAIARDIARRHGGTLVVDPRHSPGARLVLTLPLDGG
ncbi:two-component sensor histidine kinase [Cellulomonas chitinilytica]|uniref:histidine kinase n=1 Tax=Cellulomonas chitinilytica TaxID=398759 RepID=A0A919U1K6_9CELL|nr:HAMP domain-containing sensor histidine kinase [Cellulomonas chitinilytica]GIG20244.1 two-component sensor histidine kinase [Cellulomonas chitinilytica]